jgi:hypothetical protein
MLKAGIPVIQARTQSPQPEPESTIPRLPYRTFDAATAIRAAGWFFLSTSGMGFSAPFLLLTE